MMSGNNKRILLLGGTGMLGHTLFYYFSKKINYDVTATEINNKNINKYFSPDISHRIITGVDVGNIRNINGIVEKIKPDIVVNCIGIIKQLKESRNPRIAIKINSLFPHELYEICLSNKSRLIHVSTDCVFSGKKGNYTEDDFADADDLYGRSKYLGEVKGENAVTLRTSIIGHELQGKLSLVEWFLSQNERVNGYVNAIYSGFPTIELARIIDEYVIPDTGLCGLYHVSSEPVSKYELLRMIAEIYNKKIDILPYDVFTENKSLDSTRFRERTGYIPPDWRTLVERMHEWYQGNISIYK